MPLASAGTGIHVHIPTRTGTYLHIIKNNKNYILTRRVLAGWFSQERCLLTRPTPHMVEVEN
jgi:hypothetical protein